MNTTTRISTAERLGRAFGRGWRAYARGERRTSNWLVSRGVPVAGATVLLWAVKLVVLAWLFYSFFWLALLLVGIMFGARGFGKDGEDFSLPRDELRQGEAGFGLYSSDGHRLDPHDPNNPYDD
ncbi:TPA: DUF3742 family protein [Stenotrophomonas maltophilia]|jgi:hypothetical protein|uniref:DUF3742 family protein n=1 Tax=Burkholderia sp. LMG 13014 TaxID=2709306 RepID=UPI0019641CFE|nr:DUF3742 family protein [Burkholderia sp. LMG 13014]HDS1368474.1 DUF3742 family protein [Stenotrophomonas maltophilia]HEJ3239971.1 DUF3742 family protein [Pseudomonas aeruginosa]HDS1373193.1 DUF3742 family protein [Stenotrophomonas maltophilia]HDS1376516.1 DUF3742 family protein [Stenotrophomonas maltophilia]HDS1381370.1 DUF3742 family protein [Stenotrophomonas maltophilia]